jgi:hypothetical protein
VGHYGGRGTTAAAMVHRVFHDERACLLCFVHVLYGKLLPRGKMRQVSLFVARS